MVDLILLAEAAHDAAEHHAEATAFGLAPPWWVALSMVALIGIMLYLKVPAIVAGMLDKKIASIREMLDEAATLRAEAEALVAKAKTDAANVIARREKIAEDKIAAAERAAVEDLRIQAANAAAAAARDLVKANHSAEADKTLVDQAIGDI